MSKRSGRAILNCLVVGLPFAMIPVSYLINGWVLSILWGWFIVPLFGMPALTIVQAIGIAMVVGFLTHHNTSRYQRDNRDSREKTTALLWSVLLPLLHPLIALSVGWIFHLFV